MGGCDGGCVSVKSPADQRVGYYWEYFICVWRDGDRGMSVMCLDSLGSGYWGRNGGKSVHHYHQEEGKIQPILPLFAVPFQ